jgi:hypothetical protein
MTPTPTDEQLRASLRPGLERVIEQVGALRLATGRGSTR